VATKPVLALDEMETAITQTAEDRARGVWHVYSDDPYWQRRLDELAKKVRVQGPGAWYEIEHRQITLRTPGRPTRRRSTGQFKGQTGHPSE
jgi:hypothetical protein